MTQVEQAGRSVACERSAFWPYRLCAIAAGTSRSTAAPWQIRGIAIQVGTNIVYASAVTPSDSFTGGGNFFSLDSFKSVVFEIERIPMPSSWSTGRTSSCSFGEQQRRRTRTFERRSETSSHTPAQGKGRRLAPKGSRGRSMAFPRMPGPRWASRSPLPPGSQHEQVEKNRASRTGPRTCTPTPYHGQSLVRRYSPTRPSRSCARS